MRITRSATLAAGLVATPAIFTASLPSTGSQGTSNVWLRVNAGMYVAKAWVSAGTFGAC